ncbi:ArsR/SmtB family transcription factor [Halanaerobium hydrogeniformans]|uniref:Regulatory protein ArsR n=1 Tax=Halanaerobium hydrogeniformans TaxID=656519 RepID=E4RMX1_HALHG|nr:metalloregulator ArsR/SmtB family transcription factor [Halanaerobium hydrogeniformans]ADQ14188.1 regulatory protein ArsR [Halanaerobium hydrogeniformans]
MVQDDKFIDAFAEFLSILGEKSRLQILFALHEAPRSVKEIVKVTGLSQPLVSFHLKTLRERGLVGTERKKTFAYNYIIDKELVDDLLKLSKHLENYSSQEEDFDFKWPPWRNCKFFKDFS